MSALVTAADAALPAGAVFARGGEVLTSSLTVASVFGKRHDNVLRDIEAILAMPSDLRALGWYRLTTYRDPRGREKPAFDMTRDGLVFLVMSFTGEAAAEFKVLFIQEFNRMEAQLRARPAMDLRAALNDLPTLRALLLDTTGQVMALQSDLAELTPKAAALDRIATGSEGSLPVTDAAKALQVGPRWLFSELERRSWIYRRHGSRTWLGYQSKVAAGLLEHKVTTVLRGDGSEKVVDQVRITAKGLAKLAELLGAGERAGGATA